MILIDYREILIKTETAYWQRELPVFEHQIVFFTNNTFQADIYRAAVRLQAKKLRVANDSATK